MEDAMQRLLSDVTACEEVEDLLRGKSTTKVTQRRLPRTEGRGRGKGRGRGRGRGSSRPVPPKGTPRSVKELIEDCIHACKRQRTEEKKPEEEEITTDKLSQYTRFTDGMCLAPFERFLHYVPRLVNVVTLAEALPMPGSGLTLPLDLEHIAARCSSAYYAPKRFAAVQLAYTTPRARVLVFHTGRLVGTGTSGPMAARLAIAKAQRQLAVEANVHLHVRKFDVINTVGAVALKATLNCDGFATAHSSDSHFDRSSFVGLAWRPSGESICCEVYSTGRANLPGSKAERQLLESWSRMLPELLRFSSSHHLLKLIPQEQQARHRVQESGSSNVANATLADASVEPTPLGKIRSTARRTTSIVKRARPSAPVPEPVETPKETKKPVAPSRVELWQGWDNEASGGLEAALQEESIDVDLSAFGM